MNTEEILLKLGLDGSAFARGIRKAQEDIHEFSEKGHSGFVHVSSAGRDFHKLLHGLTEASPLLGTAVKLALSPVGGLLTGLVVGVKLLGEALKDANKEMAQIEKLFSGPALNIAKVLAASGKEINNINREYEKWAASHDREDKKLAESVQDRVRFLKSQEEIELNILKSKKEQGTISTLTYEQQRKLIQDRTQAGELKALYGASNQADASLSTAILGRMAQHRSLEQSNLPAAIAKTGQALEEARKGLTGAEEFQKLTGDPRNNVKGFFEFVTSGIGESLKQFAMFRSGHKLGEAQEAAATAITNYERQIEKLTEKQVDLTDQLNEQKDKLKEKERVEDEWREASKHYKDAIKDAAAKLRVSVSSPGPLAAPDDRNRATLQELAQSGFWSHQSGFSNATWWTQGPFAAQAQQIIQLEQTAKTATVFGNIKFANESRSRADLLRSQLESAGVLQKDSSDFVREIADRISGRGGSAIPVTPTLSD